MTRDIDRRFMHILSEHGYNVENCKKPVHEAMRNAKVARTELALLGTLTSPYGWHATARAIAGNRPQDEKRSWSQATPVWTVL